MGKIFQHSTIAVLMDGIFEGTLAIEELLRHGDLGIGTFHGMDGELVLVDGVAYQVKEDGVVQKVEGKVTTPYAAVTYFEAENQLKISHPLFDEVLKDKLRDHFSTQNTIQAVKVKGIFENMHCRSIAKQEKPYQRLSEVAKDQVEFQRDQVAGTLVGFYTPAVYGTVSVADFHWHFLSEEKDFGGHVFGFNLVEGIAEWQTIKTLEQQFPIQNTTFMAKKINVANLQEEIERTE